jgi:hypothetical protein
MILTRTVVASNGGIVTVPPCVCSKRDENLLPSWCHGDFHFQKAMRDALIIAAWDGIATHGTTSTKVDLATLLFEGAFGPDPVEQEQSSSTVEAATLDDNLSAALKGRQHFSNLMELAEVDDIRHDSVEPNSSDKGRCQGTCRAIQPSPIPRAELFQQGIRPSREQASQDIHKRHYHPFQKDQGPWGSKKKWTRWHARPCTHAFARVCAVNDMFFLGVAHC